MMIMKTIMIAIKDNDTSIKRKYFLMILISAGKSEI